MRQAACHKIPWPAGRTPVCSPACPWDRFCLGGDFCRHDVGPLRCEQAHGVHGAAPSRCARGEEHGALASALADGAKRGIQRGHGLADARGRLGKETLFFAQGDIYICGEFSLSLSLLIKGEGKRSKGQIARCTPPELGFLPCAGCGAEIIKFCAQLRCAFCFFVDGKLAAAHIYI